MRAESTPPCHLISSQLDQFHLSDTNTDNGSGAWQGERERERERAKELEMERNKREYDCCGDDEGGDGDEVQIISQTRSFDKFNFSAAPTSATRIPNTTSPCLDVSTGDRNDSHRNSSGLFSSSGNFTGKLLLCSGLTLLIDPAHSHFNTAT